MALAEEGSRGDAAGTNRLLTGIGMFKGMGESPIEFRVLGPLKASREGETLSLGRPQQQLTLALLLAEFESAVPIEKLIDSIWGDRPPSTARKTLQVYVSHLRGILGEECIQSAGGGYRVVNASLDAVEFEKLCIRGWAEIADDRRAGGDLLAEALGLWMGPPYAGFEDNQTLSAEAARLEELRVAALEGRIDADLSAGLDASLIGELESLVRDHPFRERFRAQLMLALYRARRQAEALRVFKKTRDLLIEELGIEPGPELWELEQRILDQDPTLLKSGQPVERPHIRAIKSYELREVVGDGALGRVYRAFDRASKRRVAVKVVGRDTANQPRFISSFEPSMQILTKLDHPHLLPTLDYWRDFDGAYVIGPWMDGGSLGAALRDSRPWAPGPALKLIDEVGAALSHAHRNGVVHGSVKPNNVLLDEAGNGYLADFPVVVDHEGPYVAPEVAEGGSPTPRADVYALGLIIHELFTGTLPDQAESASRLLSPEIQQVIRRATSADPSHRFGRVDDLQRAIRRASGSDVVGMADDSPDPSTRPRNPYKGLRAFQETDAEDFYGREDLIELTLEKIANHHLVAVVGPSGSGKSSLVKAGVVPRLREQGQALITEMFPGNYPFEELETALRRVAVEWPERGVISDLTADSRGLLRIAKQILPDDDSQMVLVIDQFEELFSLLSDSETRTMFLETLTNAATDAHSRVRVLVTLRADFFDRPLEYSEFGSLLEVGVVPVTNPSRQQLARAVAQPARQVGMDIEPGLVSEIVSDFADQPGGLPLLQFTLTEMVERGDGRALNTADYEQWGGMGGAIAARAEQVYLDQPPEGRQAVEQAFLRMVRLGEESVFTRQRVRRAELAALDMNGPALSRALQAFAETRLVTFDRDPITRGATVEVAHEALLHEWPRLRDWIEGQREDLINQRRLDDALEEWRQSGEDEGYLPTGSRLAQFDEWANQTRLALSEAEQGFLEAALRQESERRARAEHRRRRIMAGFGLAAVIASILAVVAWQNAGEAEANARLAKSRELLASASNALENDPELSILLSLGAIDAAPDTDTHPAGSRVVLREALGSFRLQRRIPLDMNVHAAAPSPDMTGIALTDQKTIEFFDLNPWARRWSIEWSDLPFADDGRAEGCFDYLSFMPSGEHVIAKLLDEASNNCFLEASDSSNSAGMVVIEAATGLVDRVILQDDCVGGVLGPVSPDGSFVPHLTCDGSDTSPEAEWRIDLLETESFEAVRTLGPVGVKFPPPGFMSWSDDGSRFLFTGWSGEGFRLYDVETGELIGQGGQPMQFHTLSPDGTRTAASDIDNDAIVVFDAETGAELDRLTGLEGYAESIVWEEGGERIIAGGVGNLAVWDSRTGDTVEVLPNTGPVGAAPGLLSFDRNSDTLIHVGRGELLIWALSAEVDGVAHSESVGFEGIFAVGAQDDVGMLFGVPGPRLRSFDPHTGEIGSALQSVEWTRWPAVLPDSRGVVAFSSNPRRDGSPLVVWDPASEDAVPLLGCPALVSALNIDGQDPCRDGGADILPRYGVMMTADASQLVVASWNREMIFIDPATLEITEGRTMPEGFRTLLAVGPDWMLGSDTQCCAIEVPVQQLTLVGRETGEVRATVSAPRITNVASDSTGRQLAIYDFPGSVTVLDTRSGERMTLAAGSGAVEGVAFSPDDEFLMTSGTDGFVRIWDLETGAEIERISLGGDYGPGLWVDENTVAIGTVTTGEWITLALDFDLVGLARSRLTRSFTPSECVTYQIDPCPTLEEMKAG